MKKALITIAMVLLPLVAAALCISAWFEREMHQLIYMLFPVGIYICFMRKNVKKALITIAKMLLLSVAAVLCFAAWMALTLYWNKAAAHPWSAGEQFNRKIAYGTLEYGGQTYRTVNIGSQTWMAENLNFATDSSKCENLVDSNCIRYGRRYSWIDATTVCPAGWRLPDDEDWAELFLAAGGKRTRDTDGGGTSWKNAGENLKSKTGWDGRFGNTRSALWNILSWRSGNGRDKFGFSALPGGAGPLMDPYNFKIHAMWWSATDYDSGMAGTWAMSSVTDETAWNGYFPKWAVYSSVRCLQGSAALRKDAAPAAVPDTAAGSFTDPRDGQAYRTVRIGRQTWMAENMNLETDNSMCYGNADSNCTQYGRLYNWSDALSACAAPWRLPSEKDWDRLVLAAGGKRLSYSSWASVGTKLKSTTGWADRPAMPDGGSPVSGNGTDEFGFSALPGGAGWIDGDFSSDGAGDNGCWWSIIIKDNEAITGYRCVLSKSGSMNTSYSIGLISPTYPLDCTRGCTGRRMVSVRCVLDSAAVR